MNIAITGHRPNKLGFDWDLKSPLIKAIKTEIVEIVRDVSTPDTKFITGMALGIDTLFALLAIELNIPFTAAIPCKNQEGLWPQKSRKLYKELVNHPLCTIVYTNGGKPYDKYCMNKRNRWMVDQLVDDDPLIAVYDGSPGGTGNCVNYAKSLGKRIIEINPKLIKF